ncbi:YitT family protein [Lacticaseibacillus kribbianus]|uniref:YitT family protein n=1 Tax=Lacticaseibacillus kribbianus TaxID=2926292 RepID=UPI001CD23826|nr:YitT family protein [Lacticaseibacillus kribbianus]
MSKVLRNVALIAVGAAVYALAINYFLIPNRIGEGGVTGLTAIGYYALNISPALTNLVLNGLLVVVGLRFLDRRTVGYTLWAILCISGFLRLPVVFAYHTDQTVIAAVFGGVLMGLAMGIILRAHGTIAGSTILAKIINKYFGVKNGTATLMFDLCVAVPSGLIIGFQNMLLTVLELYVSAVVLNRFLDSFGAKHALMVVSPHNQAIAQALTDALGQGVTMLAATGFHSQKPQDVLYFVCTNAAWPQALAIVGAADPDALIIADQVRSVRGLQLGKLL